MLDLTEESARFESKVKKLMATPPLDFEAPPRHFKLDWEKIAAQAVSVVVEEVVW